MRILTWNINGVRTLPHYHPWNTLKTHDDILNHLNADIICFQEMKSSRQNLPKSVALPPSYDSFFSFPMNKSGYSGVATYTKSSAIIPVKAEEGLTGLIQPKPPLSANERISSYDNYPPQRHESDDIEELDFKSLDGEGRAVVLDFGLFVLINVYCPNDGTGTPEREKFKMDYHKLLSTRVQTLIELEKREVIVVGDLNVCASVIDHCEGNIIVTRGQSQGMQGDDAFYEMEVRSWMRDWLWKEDGTGGLLVDVVRQFWPERKGMYTCWNTKISARDTNYGTRIDYILVTPGLLPWIKAADIQPHIKGSDHCPVYIDLRHQITTPEGIELNLFDVLGAKVEEGVIKEPPRTAAKFWDEYSGKQLVLDKFFLGKKGRDKSESETPTPTLMQRPITPSQTVQDDVLDLPSTPPLSCVVPILDEHNTPIPPLPLLTTTKRKLQNTETDLDSSITKKHKVVLDKVHKSKLDKSKMKSSAKDKKSGQQKLSSFFNQPRSNTPSSSTKNKNKNTSCSPSLSQASDVIEVDAGSPDPPSSSPITTLDSSQGRNTTETIGSGEAKQVWTSLLAPIHPPKCQVHNEPTKEFTVNKPGLNKGKKFYVCARPVGPGYDKGRSERLRVEVDPTWKCDFFKWSAEWRREVQKAKTVTTRPTL